MTAPEAASPAATPARASWRESFAVYLQPRVLIVLLLGFSSGLPLALSGSTLLVWMREAGVSPARWGLIEMARSWASMISTPNACRPSPILRPR
jgi:PAT family beta-lactamase induction signal transducer AmpG